MSIEPQPPGKARKRRPTSAKRKSAIETSVEHTGIYVETTQKASDVEGMKHLLSTMENCRNEMSSSWLDGAESAMKEALDSAHLFKGQKNDARTAMGHIRHIRFAIDQNDWGTALFETYQLGRVAQRFDVRAFEHPVAIGRKGLFHWRGHWIKLTAIEARIMAFMRERTRGSASQLFRRIYQARLDAGSRNKFDKALERLNKKLENHEPRILIRFHLQGGDVIRDGPT